MNTTTLTLNESYFAKRNALDWLFAALVLLGGLFAFSRYSAHMDGYEQAILVGVMPAAIALGWFWRPLRVLMVVVAGAALLGINLYQGDLAQADPIKHGAHEKHHAHPQNGGLAGEEILEQKHLVGLGQITLVQVDA